jgi:hypothetical protein
MELHGPDGRDQVAIDGIAVDDLGARAYRAREEASEPVLEVAGDGQVGRGRERPSINGSLQRA